MSAYKLILNAKVYIARLGDAFEGGGVVTPLIHPAADSATWFYPGCLDDLTHTAQTETDDAFTCFDEEDGLTQEVDDVVVSNGLTWKLEKTNDLVTELVFGLEGPPVPGQPMVAFGKPVPEIEMWLKIVGRNAADKSQFLNMNIYGRMKLANATAYKNGKSLRPELDFRKRGSAPAIVRFGEAL